MFSYRISEKFKWEGEVTKRVSKIFRMFGLTVDMLTEKSVSFDCYLKVKAGDVVYITGPSGSGKSVLLGRLEKEVSKSERVNLMDIPLEEGKSLIDCFECDFYSALKTLSIAGLNDVFCILNQPANLSDGQQYRYRLAKALETGAKFIFADEFCSNLDRITASVVSFQMQKFARRNQVVLFLASSNDDILADLSPDVIVSRDLTGNTEVIYKEERKLATETQIK